MARWRPALLAAGAVLLLIGGWAALHAQASAQHERGRAVYNFRCYFCHGYSGDAATLASSYLTPRPRDFTKSALSKAQIADAVRSSSIEQAKMFAAKVGGKTSIQTFVDRQSLWKIGGAMEMEVKEQTDTSYVFNVTRCKYAEMYREMGLGEIGHLLSCQRDATFCEGYDKRMRLKRSQTIMQGASHCDFQYTMVDEPKTP
ncbi:MAG: L-2-amino-thiazoline-4-carboxylic acid hydrolase [Hyphomicrobium sp.]